MKMFGSRQNEAPYQGEPAPPYRTWKVTRFKVGGTPGELETITIAAHQLKYGPMAILIFDEGVELPGAPALTERITRVLREWVEVEEVSSPVTSSLLIS